MIYDVYKYVPLVLQYIIVVNHTTYHYNMIKKISIIALRLFYYFFFSGTLFCSCYVPSITAIINKTLKIISTTRKAHNNESVSLVAITPLSNRALNPKRN